MVPNGWVKIRLENLFSFKNGVNASKEQYGNGYKFVNLMDIFKFPVLKAQDIIGSVSITKEQFNTYQVKYGDVLFNRTSEIDNEIAYSSVYLDHAPAVFGGFVIKGSPRTQKLAPKYSIYAFSANYFRSQVIRLGQGAVRSNIGQKDLNKTHLLLPPIEEQQKIAEILSTWDKAITSTEKLIANSEQQKKSLMQQLLTGKKRLLDENDVRFSGEWKKTTLGKVSSMSSGGTPLSTISEYYNGNIIWVSIADMTEQGKYITDSIRKLTQLGINNSSARIFPKHTILYAMYASIGECSIATKDVSTSQAILGIQPFDELCYQYLYFYLCSIKEKIKLQGQQGAQSNLNAAMVKSLSITLPSVKEQKTISTVLNNADREIELLKAKLEHLQQEKKALMQQLLTGKRRVVIN